MIFATYPTKVKEAYTRLKEVGAAKPGILTAQ
jgi:hypothetical protein